MPEAQPARRWAVSYGGGYGFCLRLDLNPPRVCWEHFRFPERKEYWDDALDWLLAVWAEVEGIEGGVRLGLFYNCHASGCVR